MYADDTAILVNSSVSENLPVRTGDTLTEVQVWFNTNKLKINRDKIQHLTFSMRSTPKAPFAQFQGSEGGMIFYENLKWSCHINELVGKLSSGVFSISSAKKLTSYHAAK